jgi:hypothetical protein
MGAGLIQSSLSVFFSKLKGMMFFIAKITKDGLFPFLLWLSPRELSERDHDRRVVYEKTNEEKLPKLLCGRARYKQLEDLMIMALQFIRQYSARFLHTGTGKSYFHQGV